MTLRYVLQVISISNDQEFRDHVLEADIIIEAIPEKLALKQSLFSKIGDILRSKPESDLPIIGSNTSSLDIDSIASFLPTNLQPRFLGKIFPFLQAKFYL